MNPLQNCVLYAAPGCAIYERYFSECYCFAYSHNYTELCRLTMVYNILFMIDLQAVTSFHFEVSRILPVLLPVLSH